MSRKPASTKITEDCTMRVLGGREMTMKEYAEYMQALSAKPFLTVQEKRKTQSYEKRNEKWRSVKDTHKKIAI